MINSDVRHKNLLYKLNESGETQRVFARRIGTTPNQLNHMLSGNRNIGSRAARKIEAGLKLSPGWLDSQHPEEWATAPLSRTTAREQASSSQAVFALAARIDALGDPKAVEFISALVDLLEKRPYS
jgi:transcriptional regulator with XRE-family HTH domain